MWLKLKIYVRDSIVSAYSIIFGQFVVGLGILAWVCSVVCQL